LHFSFPTIGSRYLFTNMSGLKPIHLYSHASVSCVHKLLKHFSIKHI
jgi:hypothetical protein